MSKKSKPVYDPNDGLPALVVGKWAAEKHDALTKYVEATKHVRKKFQSYSTPKRTAFLDLYCGPGRCYVESSREFIDGSPLAIARAARGCSSPFTDYIINDESAELVGACKTRLAKLDIEATDFTGAAEGNIKHIVAKLPTDGLTLAFIDPYNLVPFVTIKELARISHIDLLIHLSVYDLSRNVFSHLENRNAKLEAFAPGVCDAVTLTTHSKVYEEVRLHWLSCIEATGLQIGQRFKIVTGPKNAPLYWLVLASRNDLADKIWSSIVDSGPNRLLL